MDTKVRDIHIFDLDTPIGPWLSTCKVLDLEVDGKRTLLATTTSDKPAVSFLSAGGHFWPRIIKALDVDLNTVTLLSCKQGRLGSEVETPLVWARTGPETQWSRAWTKAPLPLWEMMGRATDDRVRNVIEKAVSMTVGGRTMELGDALTMP